MPLSRAEDSYKTLPISTWIARNNTLTNCGNPAIGTPQ